MGKVYDDIMSGLAEVEAHLKGEKTACIVHIPDEINVAKIREKTGLTQKQLAERMGVSRRTLENWEQGRRVPQGPARALLTVLSRNPKAVLDALAA